MRSKSITTPANCRLILIEDWMIMACDGDSCAAMLLSFMLYWHDIRLAQIEKAHQENKIAEMHGDEGKQNTSLLQFHNERELALGLLGIYKERTICDSLHTLTDKGFIERHSNPNPRYHFDRTRYFLLKPEVVQEWINKEYGKFSRLEIDAKLVPIKERKPKPQKCENEQQNCGTVTQESSMALHNRGVLHEITSCDSMHDSLGDTDVPLTPSQSLENEKHSLTLVTVQVPPVEIQQPDTPIVHNGDSVTPTPVAPTPKSSKIRKSEAEQAISGNVSLLMAYIYERMGRIERGKAQGAACQGMLRDGYAVERLKAELETQLTQLLNKRRNVVNWMTVKQSIASSVFAETQLKQQTTGGNLNGTTTNISRPDFTSPRKVTMASLGYIGNDSRQDAVRR